MLTSCWVFAVMNDAKQESLFQPLLPSQKVPAIRSPALWNLSIQSCWWFWAVVCLTLWVLFCKPTWQTTKMNFSFPGKRPGCALQALDTRRKKTHLVISPTCQAKPPPNCKQSSKVQFTCSSYSLQTSLWACYLSYPVFIHNFSFCPFLTKFKLTFWCRQWLSLFVTGVEWLKMTNHIHELSNSAPTAWLWFNVKDYLVNRRLWESCRNVSLVVPKLHAGWQYKKSNSYTHSSFFFHG